MSKPSDWSRRQFLGAAAGAAALAPFSVMSPARAATAPNVVLLVVDTLRRDVLDSYGCKVGASPELKEMAAAGVQFENTIAASTWTLPSGTTYRRRRSCLSARDLKLRLSTYLFCHGSFLIEGNRFAKVGQI